MKIAPVTDLAVFYEPEQGRRMRVGRLALKDREILFEYDPGFMRTRLEISPFKLRMLPGVTTGRPDLFGGLMGVFEDSLPDGWGRLLLDRRVEKEGISAATLSPLDRLAYVGSRGMGALVYEPEIPLDEPTIVDLEDVGEQTRAALDTLDAKELERLYLIGGSPAGARPKALIQVSPDEGTVLYGARAIEPDFTPYIVKFSARTDPAYSAPLELAYMRMAATAGIDVPDSRLLCRSRRHPGFFAAQRFDRIRSKRLHMHTLCGLLQAPHTYPSLRYEDLLQATRALTRDESAVAEMFRRACFNVFAHNRDDHSKNFAFLMDEEGQWRPSPAYDLTFSEGPGGQHCMLIAGEGESPGRADLERLAGTIGVRHPIRIVDEVFNAVQQFDTFADEAGITLTARRTIAKRLGLERPAGKSGRAARSPRRGSRSGGKRRRR